MNPSVAFLCKKFEITKDGLFNVENGGIDCLHFTKLPAETSRMLLADIEYDHITESGEHKIEIRIIDGDGNNKMSPILLDVDFPQNKRFYDFGGELIAAFDSYGMHSVEIFIDGTHIKSLPLNIVPEEQ